MAESLKADVWKRHVLNGHETELAKATQHVTKARNIVARQYERIAQLRAEDRPTEDAINLLNTFIQTLAALEYHQRLLCDEAEGEDKKPQWIFSRLSTVAA